MKNVIIYGLLVFILMCCSSASETNTVFKSIVGKWEWVQSSGGIAGQTTTPSSTNKSNELEISKTEIKIYENGNLIATESYSIATKKSILGGEKQMLVYTSGNPSQSFILDGNTLFLSDECYDCYQREYVRK